MNQKYTLHTIFSNTVAVLTRLEKELKIDIYLPEKIAKERLLIERVNVQLLQIKKALETTDQMLQEKNLKQMHKSLEKIDEEYSNIENCIWAMIEMLKEMIRVIPSDEE